MPSVCYKYDIDRDKWNVLRVLTKKAVFGAEDTKRTVAGLSIEIKTKVCKKSNKKAKGYIVEKYLKDQHKTKELLINERIHDFSTNWNKINDQYFEKLEKILNINIPESNTYTGYLTSAGSCPFNAKKSWFMVRLADEKTDTVTAHEIMHIEFVRVYGFYCQKIGLSPHQFNTIREAITVLLNEEMSDILSRPDYGYKEHQEYRKTIIPLWRKSKDFKHLISALSNLIK